MSPRPDDKFVMLPVQPADAWFTLKWPDRALGAAMFTVFGNDERLDVPITDVPDVVCKRLGVDGRDRPTVRRSIERIIKAKLLVTDGSITRLLYSRAAHRAWAQQQASSEPPANDTPSNGEQSGNGQSTDGHRSANGQPSTSEPSPNGGNHSGQATDKEREIPEKEEKEKTRAGARAPLPVLEGELDEGEPDPEPTTLQVVTRLVNAWYMQVKTTTVPQTRANRESLQAIAAWADEKGGDAERLVARALAGFRANSWAKKARYPLGSLANRTSDYFDAGSNGSGTYAPGSPASSFGAGTDLNLIGPGEAE